MKSSVFIILATLLTTAILAPSVITLTNIDEKAITIDFNEEEKKEEKKESKEKNLLFGTNDYLNQFECSAVLFLPSYIENDYTTSITIFLPPPEQNS